MIALRKDGDTHRVEITIKRIAFVKLISKDVKFHFNKQIVVLGFQLHEA